MKYRYKFLREGFRSNSGNLVWDTKWKHEDELIMCKKGLHCSKTKYQAFSYVQGEILAKVEVKGKSIKSEDKEVWSNMRIVRAWKWQKKDSVSLAIYSAQLVLKNFEKKFPKDNRPRKAIEAAIKYLNYPSIKNQSAAWSAARSAESAARSARSAWSAARSAAWSAESAAVKKISKWIEDRELEEIDLEKI